LDKFYNHNDTPWVTLTWNNIYNPSTAPHHGRNPVGSFWWKDTIKLSPDYRSLATCQPSRGDTVLLWKDLWENNTLQEKFPQLFSLSEKPNCSIKFFLENQVSRTLTELQELIPDIWSYSWSCVFIPKKPTLN